MSDLSSSREGKEETTRDKILAAAMDLFVERGFDASSISLIARQAGVNRSLIFHHFENKSTLWFACKTYFFEKHNTSMKVILQQAVQSRKAFIDRFVIERFRFYQQNPRFVRFIAWQSLDQEDEEQTVVMQATLERSKAVVEQLQSRGEVKSSLDSMTVMLLIHSMVSGYFVKSLSSWVSEEDEQRYLDGVVMLVEGMLAP